MLIQRLASVLAALLAMSPLAPSHSPVPAPAAAKPRAVVAAAPALRTAAAVTSVVPHPRAVLDGGDVSWPNCPRNVGIAGRHGYGLPMPKANARFVVLGATNGPAFTGNACLRSQVRWAKARHLWVSAYAVIHFPTAGELRRHGGRGSYARRLNHVGAAQARHALQTMRRAGLTTPMVWVDVETVGGHPWSGRASANRALLSGVLGEYRRAGIRTGLYSYASAWRRIMGGTRLSLPTWVPSGSPLRRKGLAKCSMRSFSGGHVLLAQWTDGMRDYNVSCPGTAATMHRWFAAT